MHRTTFRRLLALTIVGVLVVAGCSSDDSSDDAGGSDGTEAADTTIQIVAYSVPEAANVALGEAFAETPEGEGVEFETSYGASGDQSRAVAEGLDADYVHFSIPPDVTRLEDAGLVDAGWDEGPTNGIATNSVVVFAVRPGNPKGIEDWDDLIQDDVEIVTPNPASSGAARWNALAAYGQVIADGGTPEEADAYLQSFFDNVVSLPSSGRDATTAFLGGTGDVLMSYENEAILAHQNGEEFDYVVPDTNLLIENAAAVTVDAPPIASDWLDFLLSTDGQAIFASKGFRPVIDGVEVGEVDGANDPSDPFPEIGTLLTVDDDFGGWDEVSDTFFDEETGSVTEIVAGTGLSEE
jgi:sulfate transport system substrate-binding protein